MVFGRVSDIQTTYSSQFGSLGIIGLYPWTIVQIGLFYFEQFFRPKPQIYLYYTSSIYYKKQNFLNFLFGLDSPNSSYWTPILKSREVDGGADPSKSRVRKYFYQNILFFHSTSPHPPTVLTFKCSIPLFFPMCEICSPTWATSPIRIVPSAAIPIVHASEFNHYRQHMYLLS